MRRLGDRRHRSGVAWSSGDRRTRIPGEVDAVEVSRALGRDRGGVDHLVQHIIDKPLLRPRSRTWLAGPMQLPGFGLKHPFEFGPLLFL